MTVSEVRKRYLAFFAARGHAVIPSAPIVPENDATTLFTSSGMQPLVPYLLGQPHPEGVRLADSQMSFRAEDIEEIGDNRHTTFFEMLGNWSLGDYFKAEQLPWLFEYLTSHTEGLGLDPNRLFVTVFAGDAGTGMPADRASVHLWQGLFATAGVTSAFAELGTEAAGYERGMHEGERIFSYGAKKNWWSRSGVPANMPPGEPGGPDSEVFYDFGLAHDPAFGAHCHPNCDCGRFIEIGNSVFMQFIKQADGSFADLPKQNVDFGGGLERLAAATNNNPDVFLTDVFADARKALEARSGKSYGSDPAVTRSFRIILDHMRAASFFIASTIVPSNTEQGYVLRRLIRRSIREADKLGIKEVVLAEIARGYGTAYAQQYPFVLQAAERIRDELAKEEAQFRKTLVNGLRQFEKTEWMGAPDEPLPTGDHSAPVAGNAAKVLPAEVVFDLYTTYGFPIEMTEEIAQERGIRVAPGVDRLMKEHQEKSRAGAAQKFAGGLADHAEQTVRYHTVHHLLLKALQTVLAPDVHQRGSNITSERLRIDFNWGEKMTSSEKEAVEQMVNDKITEGLPVTRSVMARAEAEKLGAEHEFGAKYPEQVSVYSIGPKDATPEDPQFARAYSLEFCGGPHVANTRELAEGGKRFVIVKEEASSAGVRRIKAVLR